MLGWYIYDQGRQIGPLYFEALIDDLKGRDLTQTLVWNSSFENWTPAKNVPEIVRALNSAPPVIIPISFNENSERDNSPKEVIKRYRKGRWTKNGIFLSFALSILTLSISKTFSELTKSDFAQAFGYAIGHILALILVGAFLGFSLGALLDWLRGPQNISKLPYDILSKSPARGKNFVARHWRGELPLWISYWIIGFTGNILAILVPTALAAIFNSKSGYYPPALFFTFLFTWIAIIAISIWQLVGIWRSAAFYSEDKLALGQSASWATLAFIAVILGFFGTLSALVGQGFPQIGESFRIAFQDDPDIPPYKIRVMRNGTEAEIEGGFKYGLTDDFEKILRASRQIKVVHLNSIGGRLGEGERMFELIRNRGLDTYVSSKCISACTLAFAGGKQRYLLKNATLGFHRGAFPGVQENEFDSIQRKIFRTAGFGDKFINTALSTPHRDLWKPSAETMLAAKVVTAIVDETKFAYSGLGADLSKEQIAGGLAKIPVFNAIQIRFPKRFEAIIDDYYESHLQGRTQAETIEILRAKLMPFITSLLPLADDDVLADYNNILIDQYIELNKKNPTSCYLYASSSDTKNNFNTELSKEILERELAVQERVVRSAKSRSSASKDQIQSLFTNLRKKLLERGLTDSDFSLFESASVEKAKHRQYCSIAIAFFREVGRLPKSDSAVLLRELFLETNSSAR